MKILKGIGKFVLSIVSIPFCLVGAVLTGMLITLSYLLALPVAVIIDIWD